MVASGSAMVDSGAGKHLTCRKLCSERKLDNAAPTNVILTTVMGQQHVDKEVEMYLDGLNLTVSALALEDSPNAVSLGRLVLEHGYSLEWSPKLPRPVLRSPCGTPVELQVKVFVPYLPKQRNKISSKGAD